MVAASSASRSVQFVPKFLQEVRPQVYLFRKEFSFINKAAAVHPSVSACALSPVSHADKRPCSGGGRLLGPVFRLSASRCWTLGHWRCADTARTGGCLSVEWPDAEGFVIQTEMLYLIAASRSVWPKIQCRRVKQAGVGYLQTRTDDSDWSTASFINNINLHKIFGLVPPTKNKDFFMVLIKYICKLSC